MEDIGVIMDLGQNIRNIGAKVRGVFKIKPKSDPFAGADAPPANAPAADYAEPKKKSTLKRLGVFALLLLIPLYYFIGSILTHRINDDMDYTITDPGPGKSHTIAVIAGLIDREVNQTKWSPNIQGFEPAALLRFGGNMVNFQEGVMRACSTTVYEIENRLARSRGTSAADVDIGLARQGLARSPDAWFLAGADTEYRKAQAALIRYNDRLASGQAVFELRADNLLGVLDKIALDLGGTSDSLDKQMDAGRRVLIDRQADKIFYFSKGKAYGYFIVLRALRDDYAPVLAERRVEKIYDDMLMELSAAASLQPVIVQNASPNAMLIPNHLSTEGFYILRARAKLREITDILQR